VATLLVASGNHRFRTTHAIAKRELSLIRGCCVKCDATGAAVHVKIRVIVPRKVWTSGEFHKCLSSSRVVKARDAAAAGSK